MARQRLSSGWKMIASSVAAKKFKVKFITKKCDEGSTNGPLTKAQVQAVRGLTGMMVNNDKKVKKLSSQVEAISKGEIYSKQLLRQRLRKHNEAAKEESLTYSFAILAGAGSMLLSAVAIAVSMHH